MKFMNRPSISGNAAFMLALVVIFGSGCGKESSSEPKTTQTTPTAPAAIPIQPTIQQDNKAASEAQATTSQTPINPVVKTETYEQVDVTALKIYCATSIRRVVRSADGSENIDADVAALTVAGKPIELITNTIIQEGADAFILTKNLGKIKLQFDAFGSSTMWLTHSQEQLVKAMEK
jgi:hypothetical protein